MNQLYADHPTRSVGEEEKPGFALAGADVKYDLALNSVRGM